MLLQTRGIRAFGDGIVSVVLAAYLAALGLSDARIGIVVADDAARLGRADARPSGCAATASAGAACCSWSRCC